MVNQWLFNVLTRILPSRCSWCDTLIANAMLPLCPDCFKDLPRIPNPCSRCGLPIPRDAPTGHICGTCLQHPPAFDRLIAATRYDAPLPALITAYKFNSQLHHARLFAGLMQLAIRHDGSAQPDMILPVPLHPRRQRQRGYNQALEIARIVAQNMAIPLRHDLLQRLRHTPAQSNLDLIARSNNLRGAFRVTGKINHSHIALVDDVVTTGNTVNEIARILKKAGAQQVSVWCVARVL